MSVSALFYRGGSSAGSEPVLTWNQFWNRHFGGEKTLNHCFYKPAGEASSDLSTQTNHLFYFHWWKHRVVFGCRREKDSMSSVVVVLGSAGESKSHTDWMMRLYGNSHDVKSKLVPKRSTTNLEPDWWICELVFTQQHTHTHTYIIYMLLSVCLLPDMKPVSVCCRRSFNDLQSLSSWWSRLCQHNDVISVIFLPPLHLFVTSGSDCARPQHHQQRHVSSR